MTAIEGVSTSVTAFVGVTVAGPFNAPIRCRSYRDYELNFGGLDVESEVSYSVAQFFLNSGREAVVVRTDPDADDGWLTSIRALDGADMLNLVCLPGVSDPIVLGEAMTYSRVRRALLIVDAPRAADKPDDMLALMSGADLPKSNCAAIYYPWIYVPDPLNSGSPRLVAPSGTIAGLYARHDASRGVWKAPAGTHAPLVGVQSVAHAVTDSENAMLNPRGVNCIRVVPSLGTVAWGARTLEGDDRAASEWKYIPVRRTAFYIEESLNRGLKWVVFEINEEPLWEQIRLSAGAFMHTLFQEGAFQGRTPQEAYFVKCDAETTTQDDIDRGVVNVLVGFAPLKPAEFVMIRLSLLVQATNC